MPNKKPVTISVDQDLLDWIGSQVNRRRFADRSHAVEYSLQFVKNIDYSKGISLDVIEADPQLMSVAPFFHFEGAEDDKIFLRDETENKTVTLQIRDRQLWCDEHRTTNCVHIGFAWAIEKVRRLLRDRVRR